MFCISYLNFKAILFYIVIIFCSVSITQKLPNIQKKSVRTPLNVRVDGKALEWENKFQAYNKSTNVFYTLSNDDNNLYLVVQATDPVIIRNKIIAGGITLVIQKSRRKKDKNGISISYPIITDEKIWSKFNLRNNKDISAAMGFGVKYDDSVMQYNNNILMVASKIIKVKGLSNVDTLISIYNEERIKIAALFNEQREYTYELSVPLSLLGLSTSTLEIFSYHILLNGGPSKNIPKPYTITSGMNRDHTPYSPSQIDKVNSTLNDLYLSYLTTDFWGEYTLAKKP